MLLKKTRVVAGTAMLSALGTVVLELGIWIPVNTLFFTALAAFLVGYGIAQYGMPAGAMQLVVCAVLDFFLNPDKLHFILFLFMGGYILVSELVFRRWNRAGGTKRLRRQMFYNWLLFNLLYLPVVLFFRRLLWDGVIFGIWQDMLLWIVAGQLGWLIFDKAYREFFHFLKHT